MCKRRSVIFLMFYHIWLYLKNVYTPDVKHMVTLNPQKNVQIVVYLLIWLYLAYFEFTQAEALRDALHIYKFGPQLQD